MMAYSFNADRSGVVFASMSDINASFKDLCAVCDAIRYRRVDSAMRILDEVAHGDMPIVYRRHNRYMGARHELKGGTGRYPMKCAGIVRKVLANASANAKNTGYDPESMHVIHACANKTLIAPRSPPKGARSVVVGGYGYTSMRRSNLEFARVEIGLSDKPEGKLSKDSIKLISMFDAIDKVAQKRLEGKPKAKDGKAVKKTEVKKEEAKKPKEGESKKAETKPDAAKTTVSSA
jgi:ribosomal protein uL22